jgi:hypothetical protein
MLDAARVALLIVEDGLAAITDNRLASGQCPLNAISGATWDRVHTRFGTKKWVARSPAMDLALS